MNTPASTWLARAELLSLGLAAELGLTRFLDQDVRAAMAPRKGERPGVEIALVFDGVMGMAEDDQAGPRELSNPGRAFAQASFGEGAVAIVPAQRGTGEVRKARQSERRSEGPPRDGRHARAEEQRRENAIEIEA